MKLIAHRGVPAIAPENSLRGLLEAAYHRPDLIEFDIHTTKDGQLAVMHDPTLQRMCGDSRYIKDLDFDDIKKIRTLAGEPIPSAHEALTACGTIQAAIEGKGDGWAQPLAELLARHPEKSPIIISDNANELHTFQQLRPDLAVYYINRKNPFRAVSIAKKYGFTGVDIVYWCMNSVLYLHARLSGLDIISYTVPPAVTKLFTVIYPALTITTNNIHKFTRRI